MGNTMTMAEAKIKGRSRDWVLHSGLFTHMQFL